MTGEFEYRAVLRHYQDLRRGWKRGLVFRPDYAWHCIDHIQSHFVHVAGPKAGQLLLLDEWQLFWTAVLIGWRHADTHLRRFRTGYEEVARKNGKSTWKAGQADYLFLMDREPGPQTYVVATTRAQAMNVFKPALVNYVRRASRSPRLRRMLKIAEGRNQERISTRTGVFEPLPAANALALDGLNPSLVVVEEFHAHPTREVWDVMTSAVGGRAQPLVSAITTAGYILDGICVEIRKYLISVLRGQLVDDSFFGYIYTIDEGDDPFDERVWRKANPGLGTAKFVEAMRATARRAKVFPSARANFLTKDLNVWVNSALSWFELSVWDKGGRAFDREQLHGRRCFGALDMSSTRDLTTFVLLFPPDEGDGSDDDEGEWFLLVRVFVPRAKLEEQLENDMAPYADWEAQGWLTVTEGNVTDYSAVREAIVDDCAPFDVVEFAYDKWNCMQLATELLELGVPMVEVPQNMAGLSPGAKLLERIVYGKRLRHGGNPVLRWCAGNVTLYIDSNENIKPNKKRSGGRIDPIVATCMAATRALVHRPEPEAEIHFL
ncbi:terminase large subunit [Paraburkholderia susongensis]|uniref:Phage terminase-like protein, large subunit, contains N-terminal HTH domain n=1 Tax=Paraburkholderia susongensis TaxID=1515439 RepID=A0A1X7I590_9BURK|nr:terminase TerL endonuclease subunit [Paraburkholderia susongensis]SMG09616.1 Phage terminase-like protein, large subunit, contains N-terminal HTH domain [Paraburkholderia susongensis]